MRYRHYKSGVYVVIGSAIHAETLEAMIIYQNEDGLRWVRPASMFFGKVIIGQGTQNERSVWRFEALP